jgi:hypothetical protein
MDDKEPMTESDYRRAVVGTLRTIAVLLLVLAGLTVLVIDKLYDIAAG